MFTRNFHSFCRGLVCSAVLAFAPAGLRAQPAGSAPLAEELFPQLKPILERALTQSPSMLQRNIDLALAEANRMSARSLLLPNLGSSATYTTGHNAPSEDPELSSRSNTLSYGVNLGQPVFLWGIYKAQFDSAKIGVRIAEKNYVEAYRLLAVNIRTQYTGLIIRKISLRNADFGLKLALSNLAIEEERLRTGRISRAGIIAPQLALEEARLGRDRAQAALGQSIRYFCQITGLATLEVSSIPDDISLGGLYYSTDFAGPLLAKFLSADIENTVQAQIYRDYIEQAKLGYKVARFRLYPKFFLGANYGLANSTTVDSTGVKQSGIISESASLTASWPLFDGFATKAAKRSALLTKRNNEHLLETYLRSTADQITELERQLNFAARTMYLSDTRRDIQAGAAKQVEADRIRGVGSQIAVDSTRAASYGSDLNAVAARAEFLARWAEFLSALNLDPALQNLPARYLSHAK